ncbi:MAG: hypothetical protein LKJ50_03200 [Clostridiales bacterium]|jgi:hypothetical protein|nr:hypothetical protein [Clostridiales bacterium]MCI1960949.1 hypothetical protein [Clostridiales bacterium]MCI2021390.1 hypothetical protein [Clostridiales bacterium]MCI2025773.1 hypothetical protein [Clostridiales bacterium]
MEIMQGKYTRLAIIQVSTGKEIAVVTDDETTTANPDIVVKLTPSYDKSERMSDTEKLNTLKGALLSFVVRVTDEKRIAAPEEIAVLPKVAEVLATLLI